MNRRATSGPPRDPDVIEDEIDVTRSSLEETVEELQRRLSSRAMLDRAFTYTRSASADFGSELVDTVRYNPVPTLLTGVGIAWLMAASRGNHAGDGDYASHRFSTERVRRGASGAKHKLHEGSSRMRDSAQHGADRVRSAARRTADRVSSAGERTRERMHATGASARNIFEDQPLLVGALAVAVGATLGALLPPTRTEDEYLGDASDRVKSHAKSQATAKARDTMDEARERVEERSDTEPGRSSGVSGERPSRPPPSPHP